MFLQPENDRIGQPASLDEALGLGIRENNGQPVSLNKSLGLGIREEGTDMPVHIYVGRISTRIIDILDRVKLVGS